MYGIRMKKLWMAGVFALVACAGGQAPQAPAPVAAQEPPEPAETEGAREAASRDDPAPPLTPAQRAARRVATLKIDPSEIQLRVGESVLVDVVAMDSAGRPVEGVQVRRFLRSSGASFDPISGEVTGHAAGEGIFLALLLRPGPSGRRGEPVEARAPVRVDPPPITRIDLEAPEPLFAGHRYRVDSSAYAEEVPREDVAFEWSSSDARVARVSRLGILSTGEPGRAVLTARAEGVEASVTVSVAANPVRSLVVEPATAELRTGDVLRFSALAETAGGREVEGVPVEWSVANISGQLVEGAFVDAGGAFVANDPGHYLVTATAGERSATAQVEVSHRGVRGSLHRVGHGVVDGRSTSDLWVFEGLDGRDYAYTGTHAAGAGGNVMYAWDVTDPESPVLTDSVVVDARVVNDVKISQDATLAVITREGASNRRNGIVVLDIQEPAHPRILSEYTETLTGGVHNVWIEGELVYAVHNGTLAVHIVDISDPAVPREVGRWELEKEQKYLHDVSVKDGLAYLSYWNDGLVILDVGAGIRGGTPTDPRFVSQIQTEARYGEETFGNTHHAFRYKNWVFLGDEIFGCSECRFGPRGHVHVIDVTDIENPREVAWYRVPEAGTHNLWVEDDKLYVAYYQGGLRVVDVSGELRGDLYRQGREIAWFPTAGDKGFAPHQPMAWGPQRYKGHIYVSDLNSGLWILRLAEPERVRGP